MFVAEAGAVRVPPGARRRSCFRWMVASGVGALRACPCAARARDEYIYYVVLTSA
ncbi:hypothetical protein A2U01_0086330, partial [Trifolium medium]|nr:hypothetical protein [Trifolium medium]